MKIQQKKLSTSEDYTNFVREFVTMLDKQFIIWENRAKNKEYLHDLANQMPAIISLVNTMGYLRGQNWIFLEIRPMTNNQKEFYEYENMFENRINKLINIIMTSEEKNYYIEHLKNYLVDFRTE